MLSSSVSARKSAVCRLPASRHGSAWLIRGSSYGIRRRAATLVCNRLCVAGQGAPRSSRCLADDRSCRLPALALAVWVYLVFARGRFWLGRERDDARDHAAGRCRRRSRSSCRRATRRTTSRRASPRCCARTIRRSRSCWSTTTATTAPPMWRAAPPRRSAQEDRLTIVTGAPLPPRWTGKLWAVKQGIAAAEEKFAPKYLMLTDADIVHAPDTLRWLVAHAEAAATRAHLAHRALALREPGRARAHPGLHLSSSRCSIRSPG